MIGAHAPRTPSRAWPAAGSVAALVVGALLVWLLRTPVPALRAQLWALQFWSLEACVFVGLAVAAAVLHELMRTLDRRDIVAALLLGAVAGCLTLTLPPRMHRIFYDEQIYQSVGQNLADSKRAQLCNDGAFSNGRLRCAAAEYNKQPYAFPHVLSLMYRMFGVGPVIPFAVNAAAMGLAVCFLYLLVLVLFVDRTAAFFAAIFLALTPEQLVWAASAAAEPSASLACISALLAAACFIRSRSDAALAGAAIAAAYAVQFRPESFLIVPVVALLVWQRAPEECLRPRIVWAGLLFLALAAVHIGHLAAVRTEGWGTTAERMSIAYAGQNLRVNGWFFLLDRRFPAAFAVLALAGLAAPRGPVGRAAMALYFALFFGIALFFYAGSYDYGADVRYSVATYPPIAALAGLGAARLARWSERFTPYPAAGLLIAAAAVGQFAWVYLPVVRSATDSAWAARADVEFAQSFVSRLPHDAYVLTHNPAMFHVWGVNAGQMSLATAPGGLDALGARFPGGVYLHWNYWCNTEDRVQTALCVQVRDLRPLEAVGEYRLRDQHFVFYRMRLRVEIVSTLDVVAKR
jgi:Dolichyl-phosphate-mannose-protein mannosyltransferase